MPFYHTSYQHTAEEYSILPRCQDRLPSQATLCTTLYFSYLYSITPTLSLVHGIPEVYIMIILDD